MAIVWRRAVDLLAPLGRLVIVGAEAWQRSGRTLPGKEQYYLAAAWPSSSRTSRCAGTT